MALAAPRSPAAPLPLAGPIANGIVLAAAALAFLIVGKRIAIGHDRLRPLGLVGAPVALMVAAVSGGLRSPAIVLLAFCGVAVSWGRRPRTAAIAAGLSLLLLLAIHAAVAGAPTADGLVLAAALLGGLVVLPSWMAARAAGPLAEALRRVDQLERFLGNARLTPEQPHLAFGRRSGSPRSDEPRGDGVPPEAVRALLRMAKDHAGGDDAIFFRINRKRDALEAVAWVSDGDAPVPLRPEWQALVQWCASEQLAQCDIGEGDPSFVVAPVPGERAPLGAVCVVREAGLVLPRHLLMEWTTRYATAVGRTTDLLDARRRLTEESRRVGIAFDSIDRFQRAHTREELGQLVCRTVLELSGAERATIVRWQDATDTGEVVSTVGGDELPVGLPVDADSLVGEVCREGTPQRFEDARNVSALRRIFGQADRGKTAASLAVYPLKTDDRKVVGAAVVESSTPGAIGAGAIRALRNLSKYAAMSIDTVWKLADISQSARTDPLTGLFNRRHFDEQIVAECARHDRNAQPFSLLIADIDHFKRVNDTHGHEAGDAVLKAVAKLFHDTVRTTDVCARFGGEEIAVLLPETPTAGALELAERLRIAIAARPVTFDGRNIAVTASFGVATFPHSARSREDFFPAADKALYRAKKEGRNCVRYAPPILTSRTT